MEKIPNVPPQLVDQVANSGKAHIASAPGTRLMFLGMNSAYKPWDNVKLRQAVNYAIGKEGIGARLVTPEWGKIWPDIQAGRSPFYLHGRGAVEDPGEYLEPYFKTGVTPR